MSYESHEPYEAITIDTLDDYYAQYPDAERIDGPDDTSLTFDAIVAANSIQVIRAPKDPALGEVAIRFEVLAQEPVRPRGPHR